MVSITLLVKYSFGLPGPSWLNGLMIIAPYSFANRSVSSFGICQCGYCYCIGGAYNNWQLNRYKIRITSPENVGSCGNFGIHSKLARIAATFLVYRNT